MAATWVVTPRQTADFGRGNDVPAAVPTGTMEWQGLRPEVTIRGWSLLLVPKKSQLYVIVSWSNAGDMMLYEHHWAIMLV